MKFEVIKQVTIIEAGPVEVYEAYADPKKHAAFTGDAATGTAKVGGKFAAGSGYISGKYLELEKGKRILHEWTTTEWPKGYPPSLVELILRSKGKKTELTMIQSKVPAEQAADYAQGWKDYYWEPMTRYFRSGNTKLRP